VGGGTIFPEPWQGVVAAVLLIQIINQGISLFNKRRATRAARADEQAGAAS
jgi:hypothetical protein